MSSLKQKVQDRKKPSHTLSRSSPDSNNPLLSLKKYFLGVNRKVSFKNLLDAYLSTKPEFILQTDGKLSRNKLIGFHPSSLHNNCPRRIAFGLINEKGLFLGGIKESELDDVDSWITPKVRRTFDTGHMIHFLIQYGYLVGMKKKYKVEIPITTLYEKYLIGGTSDVQMILQDGNEWVLDLKSIKAEMFMKLNESDFTTLQRNYLIQLILYLFGLGKKRGGIVYWNKNDGDIKEFYFEFPSFDAMKYFIKNELEIALQGKQFLSGKGKPVPILLECQKQEGRYDKCEYSTVCFRCNKPEDLIRLTKVKKFHSLTK